MYPAKSKSQFSCAQYARASILLLVWFACCLAHADVVPVNSHLLFYDGFEKGISGDWIKSNTSDISWYTQNIKLGQGAVLLEKGTDLSRTFDTTGYNNIVLQVSLAGWSFESNEDVVVEYYSAGSWQIQAFLGNPGSNAYYQYSNYKDSIYYGYYNYYQISLPADANNRAGMMVRFRLTSTQNLDYGYIDEVYLQGQPLAAPATDNGPDCQTCIADFALYNPYYEDNGVWEEEARALRTMFELFGWTYQIISYNDLNSGLLLDGQNRKYRALIVPGGFADSLIVQTYRNNVVTTQGKDNIRSFVNVGGNYLGFCAGAYWATTNVVWAQNASGGSGTYNQASDYQSYTYDLSLLDGTAQGPFSWTPWSAGTYASLELTSINLNSPVMAAIGMPSQTRFFYYGGPFFPTVENDGSLFNLDIWARAKAPDGTATAASTGDGKPTVIQFRQGSTSGNVILFSHHPDILIGSNSDGVVLTTYIDETLTAWNTTGFSQAGINQDSWNIVHAALQIMANESPTRLPAGSVDGIIFISGFE